MFEHISGELGYDFDIEFNPGASAVVEGSRWLGKLLGMFPRAQLISATFILPLIPIPFQQGILHRIFFCTMDVQGV